MRRPRYIDFSCSVCSAVVERFVETNDDNTLIDDQVCEAAGCGGALAPCEIGTRSALLAPIQKGNHDFSERERERLEKRGDEHWKREGRHEAIERERAILKKNGMEGAGGVR